MNNKNNEQDNKDNLKAGLLVGGLSTFMLIFLLMWFVPSPARFVNHIGINQTALEVPIAWVLAAAVAIGYIAYTAFAVPTVKQNLFNFNNFKFIGIYAAFTSGIVEEIVFRQMLMDRLQTNGVDVIFQILISGLLFGAVHFGWALFSGSLRMGIGAAISTTVLGLLLAVIYIVAARNVLPAIMAHMMINFFIEPWLILHAVKEDSGSVSEPKPVQVKEKAPAEIAEPVKEEIPKENNEPAAIKEKSLKAQKVPKEKKVSKEPKAVKNKEEAITTASKEDTPKENNEPVANTEEVTKTVPESDNEKTSKKTGKNVRRTGAKKKAVSDDEPPKEESTIVEDKADEQED